MPKLKFYDVKTKKNFTTDNYTIKKKGMRYFAVAKSPSGPHECYRIVSKDYAKKYK